MGNIPEKLLAGSVSRTVYSLFHGLERTLFAQRGGGPRTVFVRITLTKTTRRWT
jgi:hypothetical protein